MTAAASLRTPSTVSRGATIRRGGRSVRKALLSPEVGALVGLFVVWELTARYFDVSFLPPVTEILDRFFELLGDPEVWSDISRSLRNLALGFGITVVAGVPLGMLMARFRVIQYAVEPYLNALLVAPTLVFAPIFFVVFGLSPMAVVAVIVMYSLFLVSLSTFYAMRNVDSALIDMARTLGASEVEVFFRIMVPAASPLVFAGLRVGLARSVKGMINGEMFIAAVGLGARTMEFGSMFDAAGVLAIVLLIVIIALITTGLFQMIERRVTRWTELGRS